MCVKLKKLRSLPMQLLAKLSGYCIATVQATGQAVATTHMFGHAIHASTYAVKSVAYATNFDAIAVANQRTWQYQHLLDLWKTD
ncbi:hypothetical protein P9597_10780 [Aneurinibacillus migulanus]|uniref:putative immunity protein n=1 Tax=Aneurinibacillus migulanus TaxID=47500 RepID=UPI002E23368F|nr:hypothetical protein [Aneurinibacillus migulanus]